MPAKSKSQAIDEHAPWKPAAYEAADVAALQAMQTGSASPAQQKRVLEWVIRSCCRTYDLSYRPGEDGRRDTDFAEGRRSVGLQLVTLLNLKLGSLTQRGGEQS